LFNAAATVRQRGGAMEKFKLAASDFLQFIANKGVSDDAFERVLLHIRMRGIQKSQNLRLFLSVFASLALRLFGVIALVGALFCSLKSVLISSVVSLASLHFFHSYMSFLDFLVLFFSALVVLNAKQCGDAIFCIFFDVLDLFTLGGLSKIYANMALKVGVKRFSSGSDELKSQFVSHFYATRQLWSNMMERFEEDRILNDYMRVRGDESAAKKLIDGYWAAQEEKN
jgi:hypothetical protein